MRQKLGLCCALIHDPDLLILDEPTTGVDPLSRRRFWELMERLRRRRPDLSILVSTAYMEEAERFDMLVAMDAGQVLACGTLGELRASTGERDMEEVFVALLPEDRRGGHRRLEVLPRGTDGDGPPAIRAEGLTRRFGDFTAVDRVSLSIPKGEIFGFLGSNGSGKTTTMRMLTGLLPVTEGQAWVFDQPVEAEDAALRRRLGFMSQSFSLYGELTVRAEPGPARPPLSPAARAYPPAHRGAHPALRPRQASRRPRRGTAAWGAPAPVARGGGDPRAGAPDPGRAHLRGRSHRPGPLLGAAPRSLPGAGGDHLHLHPLHERGGALRPHLADARRACPRPGHPRGPEG